MRSFRHDILVYNTFNKRADSKRSAFFFAYTLYDIRAQTGDKNWRDDCQIPMKRILCGRSVALSFFLLFIYSYYTGLSPRAIQTV